MPDSSQSQTDSPASHKFQVHIDAPVQAVWDEITKQDDVIPAFFNTQMHVKRLEPGAKMAMRTKNKKYTGVVGEILEVNEPTRFAHTFRFTNFEDPPCKVIYDLEEKDGGTQFTMTITDLPEGTRTAKQMLQGGNMITKTLKRTLEKGKPSLGIRTLYTLFKLLEPMSPKKCRSENWPVD